MRNVLKWVGIALGGLVIVLAVAVTFLSWRGRQAFQQTFEVSGLLSATPLNDSASVAEGARQAQINVCFFCHGEDLGGTTMIDAPPFFIAPPNLTSGAGGLGGQYTTADWDRSIRHGVHPSGRPLIPIMPTQFFHNLGDEEFLNLVSYLSQLPAVDRELPPSRLRLMGQALAGIGALDPRAGVVTTPSRTPRPPRGPTPEFGAYLASITCAACHGTEFQGAPAFEPDTPDIPAIRTAGLWPFEAFDNAVRRGQAPDGRSYHINMPSKYFAHMTEEEVRAIHSYLATLPASPPATP